MQTILEALKLRPRHLVAIALLTGVLLGLPDAAREFIGIRQLADDYRQWFGLAFLISVVLLIVQGGEVVVTRIRHSKLRHKSEQAQAQRLQSLTEEEKQILRFYVVQQTKTGYFQPTDGVINGLAAAGLIHPAAPFGNSIQGLAYNIHEFAWEYLHKHPETLLNHADSNSSR